MKALLLEMPEQIIETGILSAKMSIWRSALLGCFMFALALMLVPTSFGQGITGSITGTVTDSSGASIAGATVTIRQVDTNAIRTVTTSDVGSYTVTQLAPGTYSVKVDKTGFEGLPTEQLHACHRSGGEDRCPAHHRLGPADRDRDG